MGKSRELQQEHVEANYIHYVRKFRSFMKPSVIQFYVIVACYGADIYTISSISSSHFVL